MIIQAQAVIGVILFIIGAYYDKQIIQNKPLKNMIVSLIGVLGGTFIFADAVTFNFLSQIFF